MDRCSPHDSPASNPAEDVPFKQAYWVVPDKLMAGCYPGSENRLEAFQKLEGLLKRGIRHVINLMEPKELNRHGRLFVPYEDQMKSIALCMGCQLRIERMPIKDMQVPAKIEMGGILDRIDQCLADRRPVYIHCLGGLGRTGTVVGCYLARHGYAARQEILKLIQQLRRNTSTCQRPSPETRRQIELVLSWRKGE